MIEALAILAAIYFLPSFLAAGRRKRNAAAIRSVNAWLGWTLIGWIIALVWAMAPERER